MNNITTKKIKDYYYRAGYDCGMNGASEKNCHFSLFSTKDKMQSWERGKSQAIVDKSNSITKQETK